MVRAGFTLWGWVQVVPANTRSKAWSIWLFSEFWITTAPSVRLSVIWEWGESLGKASTRRKWENYDRRVSHTFTIWSTLWEGSRKGKVPLGEAVSYQQELSGNSKCKEQSQSRGAQGSQDSDREEGGASWTPRSLRTTLRTVRVFHGAFSCLQGPTLREQVWRRNREPAQVGCLDWWHPRKGDHIGGGASRTVQTRGK